MKVLLIIQTETNYLLSRVMLNQKTWYMVIDTPLYKDIMHLCYQHYFLGLYFKVKENNMSYYKKSEMKDFKVQ